MLLLAPKAGVLDEALLLDPNPPKVEPVLLPPKRPPPVVELPNGFEPKALLFVLLAPKPPVEIC